MSDLEKLMKVLTRINIVMVVLMYVLCFLNQPDNIPGVCDECSAGTSMTFGFAIMLYIPLLIMAVAMWFDGRHIKKKSTCDAIRALCKIGTVLAVIILIMFLGNPSINTHGEATESGMLRIDMLNIQYVLVKIICVLLVGLNMLLSKASLLLGKKMENEKSNE